MGLRIGVVGVGRFSKTFIPLFNAHPIVDEVVLCEIVPERLKEGMERFGIRNGTANFDELCRSDIDAVAIISQRQLHGPQTIQALRAGKHVYSAVPMGMCIEEIRQIVDLVEETGLLYMMGETSYYYPSTIYCRDRFQRGDFGAFTYAEAQYLHDMDHFYASFQHSGGENWKQLAGLPPMYYPTHTTSMILSVTGEYATHVSCLGQVDEYDKDIFAVGKNNWDNVFSNQSALMRTSDGGIIRINEMRRVGRFGGNSVSMSFYGTEGAYEESALSNCWVDKGKETPVEDITEMLACKTAARSDEADKDIGEEFFSGMSPVHNTARLPNEFKGMPNGHSGSHQFLVDDFVRAWAENKLPPCHAWNAARWNIPGLIAHESSKRNGEMMPIPDCGQPPADAAHLFA
jgi:predicted dehydrogenase